MRCFVAIELPPEVKAKLAAFQNKARALGLDASFPSPENTHLTLVFLGEITEEEAKRKISALQTLSFPPFSANVRGLGFFPNESRINVFWAGVEAHELSELQERVASLLDSKNEKPFSGHVTLARVKSPKNLDALRKFKKENAGAAFGSFTVDAVHFKKSTLTPEGPVYEDLAAVPLKAKAI